MKQTIYSVVMTKTNHLKLIEHLIRSDGQEDLCFATYIPSSGSKRFSGIISHLIFPLDGERNVHGNVGFMPEYFERALKFAASKNEGLTFLHSHPFEGWQDMSDDDIIAENRISAATFSLTKLPLLGLTLGTDGAWSARFWIKNSKEKRAYERQWCQSVRVVGKELAITFNSDLVPFQFQKAKQIRTISAWGQKTQGDLTRLKIGIVGLGSVGSVVAEILARTGISKFVLIDFDIVEEKNLDRITNVYSKDIGEHKVEVISKAIKQSASAPLLEVSEIIYSVCERQGFEAALDCDVIFSCVDRPWPRQVLNFIAYAHLIPIIDGGIMVRTNKDNSKIKGADWKAQTVGNQRACLECLGQYNTANASLEKSGLIDDPDYVQGMEDKTFFEAKENVFAFSSSLASMEVLQFLSLFISPSGISDLGQQLHHFTTGKTDVQESLKCHEKCYFQTIIGKGDYSGIVPYGEHGAAEKMRSKKIK